MRESEKVRFAEVDGTTYMIEGEVDSAFDEEGQEGGVLEGYEMIHGGEDFGSDPENIDFLTPAGDYSDENYRIWKVGAQLDSSSNEVGPEKLPGVLNPQDDTFPPQNPGTTTNGGENEMTEVGPSNSDVRELAGKTRHDYATKQLLDNELAENESEAEQYAAIIVDIAESYGEFEQMAEDFQQVVDDMVTYLDGNQEQLENMVDSAEYINRTLEGAVRTAVEVNIDEADKEYDLGPIGRQHLNSLHNFVESVYGEDE